MRALAIALLLAWVGFSVLWLVLVDPHDWVALFIGLQILLPSLCVVPYLSLITGWPFAAVVFTAPVLPRAFTEPGAIMAANVLNSTQREQSSGRSLGVPAKTSIGPP